MAVVQRHGWLWWRVRRTQCNIHSPLLSCVALLWQHFRHPFLQQMTLWHGYNIVHAQWDGKKRKETRRSPVVACVFLFRVVALAAALAPIECAGAGGGGGALSATVVACLHSTTLSAASLQVQMHVKETHSRRNPPAGF